VRVAVSAQWEDNGISGGGKRGEESGDGVWWWMFGFGHGLVMGLLGITCFRFVCVFVSPSLISFTLLLDGFCFLFFGLCPALCL
jgi:hypothetical protein